MVKIDLEKFICSLIEAFPDFQNNGRIPCMYEKALKEQNLEYKDGQIVEISETKPLEIKAGHWYMCIKDYGFCEHDYLSFEKGEIYKSEKDEELTASDGGKWPFGDAKDYFRPATEEEIPHEPKFKKDDFIVDMKDHEVFHVSKVLDNTYEIVAINDNSDYHLPHYTVETNYRNWDITKDAKDGDVLVVEKTDISHKAVFIFNKIEDNRVIHHFFQCWVTDSEEILEERTAGCFIGFITKANSRLENIFHPATQEQRELLFSKMTEAGYIWDTENKQLLKKPESMNIPKKTIVPMTGSKEELTEFEMAVVNFAMYFAEDRQKPENEWQDEVVTIKNNVNYMLSLARKQIAEEVDIEGMVEIYRKNPEEGTEFGLPVACMVRAYRQGVLDVIKEIK